MISIDIDIDDILFSCSKSDKKELYAALIEDGDCLTDKELRVKAREEQQCYELNLMTALQHMSNYELKKTLCDLLRVPTYCDSQALRTALEPIITA